MKKIIEYKAGCWYCPFYMYDRGDGDYCELNDEINVKDESIPRYCPLRKNSIIVKLEEDGDKKIITYWLEE